MADGAVSVPVGVPPSSAAAGSSAVASVAISGSVRDESDGEGGLAAMVAEPGATVRSLWQ